MRLQVKETKMAILKTQNNDKNIAPATQQQMISAADDPFQNYMPIGTMDTPVTYGNSLAESLLNDNEVPEEIRKKFWWIFHKDNTLGFIDEERKKAKMLAMDIMKCDYLATIDYYDYNFDLELKFGVLRNAFETKLDRAQGFKGAAQKNERIVLQSQFSEQKQIHEESNANVGKQGFFKRLLGRK